MRKVCKDLRVCLVCKVRRGYKERKVYRDRLERKVL